MYKKLTFILILSISVTLPLLAQTIEFVPNKPFRLNAATADINTKSSEKVADERLTNKEGVTLKSGIEQAIEGERDEPDLIFRVKAPDAGRYVMHSYAVTDEEGAALMKKASSKYESMYMRIQIDDQRATKRVVYVPWDRPLQRSGKFALTGEEQEIKIWLPRGVRLEYLQLQTYVPPKVPEAAVNYKPTMTPPASHPRILVNKETLPLVKARLQADEHKAAWEKVKKAALVPFVFEFDPSEEMSFNADLEVAAEMKAFYYLMTGDREIGREAIELMAPYLSHVEFGNLLDITREMGRAIFIASEVYDWTYDLLTEDEKKLMVNNLMRLADDMEIGWPPFLTSIVNGHGNEAQVNRDLLAMSIAIYNENPLPYQYTSYAVLETLVPMRKFEYQSPRHNQGVGYAAYRFAWEMHAAWLMYRMTDKPAFDDNIKDVSKYFLYMRTPNGQMLRDGDGFGAGAPGKPYYWKSPMVMFLMSAYSADPVVKGEFLRHGGLNSNPVLFLLLNDPELKAEPSLESLPLTIDFGPILGSMITRTGWDISDESDDVVAEIKGGGYHFGNHQHADAGSMQLYYRGFQLGDIGLYKFYGTPYDLGFNKRSISHSMMLAVDPDEEFYRSKANDGGARFNQRAPTSAEQVQTDPWFDNGKVVSASYGPSEMKPPFSYFSVDLEGAYSYKISKYTRSFMFLNLENESVPAAIILTDDMQTSNPNFKKYWQINTLNVPEKTADGLILNSKRGDKVGKTHVQMLVPSPDKRTIEIFSGEKANSAFETQFEAPPSSHPEGRANRIMISPENANGRDRFLTVFQIVDGNTEPLPINYKETDVSYVIYLADRVISMSNSSELIDKSFLIDIPSKGKGVYQVALAGLEAGKWVVKNKRGKVELNAQVEDGKNTIFFEAGKGSYTIERVDSA
ncbi:hypothetical protein [Albibacterium indicum]|uniref:hypothetical protein n=1 Tax=Albibacterium indicum TaxID=2292082 RepID=UPI000E54B13B|nr:hypothetical protein [Pedobacter indicus]